MTAKPADAAGASPMERFFAAVNRLDADAMETLFSPNVRYEHQAGMQPLKGREAVLDYLRHKFDTTRNSRNRALVELGEIDGKPCGILYQDGQRRALLVVAVNPAGEISAVDFTNITPDPAEAQGSGQFPGLGKIDPKQAYLGHHSLLPRATRLRLVGFSLDGPMTTELRHAMRRVAGYYPNVEAVIRNHAPRPGDELSADERELIAAEQDRFRVAWYPSLAVEAGGRVIVPCHDPAAAENVDRILGRLVEPAPYKQQAMARHGGEHFPDGRPVCIDRFEGDFEFLSNFGPGEVVYEGRLYPTVENAFQAAKSTDADARRQFEHCSPDQAKRLGRRSRRRDDWGTVRVDVMHELLRYKFRDARLREQLLETGDALLVEGNWWGDQFWGVSKDVGENQLGRLLMSVREQVADRA